jgi:RNA polymerase sigma-70 factor (ECF subfamily)
VGPPPRRGRLVAAAEDSARERDVRRGDPGVLTQRAFIDLRGRLERFVARRAGRGAEAEDLVQTVYLRFHERLRERRPVEDVPAFLFAAARHAIVDEYRSAWRRRVRTTGDAQEFPERPDSGPTPDGEGERARAARCLPRMLDRLSERDRRALTEVDLGGRTQVEASRAEGLSVAGMKARVQRARARLKALYTESCRISRDGRGALASCEPKLPGHGNPCGGSARARGPEPSTPGARVWPGAPPRRARGPPT